MDPIWSFIREIGANPLLTLVSFLIAVFSLLLAVFFYLRSRKVRLPYYAVRSVNLVRDLGTRIESVTMLYKEHQIETLTVSKIAFWNAGAETINRGDIATADPLSVRTKGDLQILNSKIICANNPANRIALGEGRDRREFTLDFEYLDKDEGAVIQVLHTGTQSDDIQMTGTVKGAGKPIRKPVGTAGRFRLPSPWPMPPSLKPVRVSARLLGLGLVAIATFFLAMLVVAPNGLVDASDSIGPVIGLSPYLLFGLYLLWRPKIPKGLEVFEEEL